MNRLLPVTLRHLILSCCVIISDNVSGQKTTVMIKQCKYTRSEPIVQDTDSFRRITYNSDVLIDRSLLIKELLDNPEKRVVIVSPPKWGKSININMIKTFAQIVVDNYGNPMPASNVTPVYALFKRGIGYSGNRNESFTRPFLISKHQDVFDKHLSQHPIVHMRFKFVEGLNDVEVINNLRIIIQRIHKPHKYLLKVLESYQKNISSRSPAKSDKARIYYQQMKRIFDKAEDDDDVLINSVQTLCKLLYRHHRKRVLVLIDDYDLPFYRLLHSHHFVETDIGYVTKYIEKLVDPILAEDYPYVERVIITNTYHIGDIMGPNFNSIPSYTLVNNPWLEYFSISDREQQLLCGFTGKTDEQCLIARQWYMGYKNQRDPTQSQGNLYSTSRFLATRHITSYVFEALEFNYMFRLIKTRTFRKIIESLINNHTVIIKSFKGLRFNKTELHHFKHVAIAGLDVCVDDDTVDLALSHFCATGYLTFDQQPNGTANVWIPNIESMADISKKLRAYYNKTYGISYTDINKLVYNLRDYVTSYNTKPFSATFFYLKSLFGNINEFMKTHPYYKTDTFEEDVMSAILNYISIMWRVLSRTQTNVWTPPNSTASFMVSALDVYGVVIAMQYNNISANVLNAAKSNRPLLEQHQNLRVYKFIAIAVDWNDTIHLRTHCKLLPEP